MALTVTTKRTSEIENENLEAHVEICRHRYENLEKRVLAAETNLNELREFRDQIRWEMIRTVSTVVTLVVAIGTTITIFVNWVR